MRLPLLLAPLFLLAGCIGALPQVEDEPPSADPGDSIAPEAKAPWSMMVGAGTPAAALRSGAAALGDPVAHFDVPEGTAHMRVESAWTCLTGPACAVNVTVWRGSTMVGNVIGTDHSTLDLEAPGHIGDWRIIVYPAQPASVTLQVEGESLITFVHEDADQV